MTPVMHHVERHSGMSVNIEFIIYSRTTLYYTFPDSVPSFLDIRLRSCAIPVLNQCSVHSRANFFGLGTKIGHCATVSMFLGCQSSQLSKLQQRNISVHTLEWRHINSFTAPTMFQGTTLQKKRKNNRNRISLKVSSKRLRHRGLLIQTFP